MGLPKQPYLPGLARADKQPRAPRQSNPELVQQTAYFRFVRLHAARYPILRWIHSIPNGAFMHRKTAADMVASGLTAGIWDIHIPEAGIFDGRATSCAYIEMKAGKNKLTPKQEEFYRDVIATGMFGWAVCRDWIEAAVFTLDYFQIDDKRIREMLR